MRAASRTSTGPSRSRGSADTLSLCVFIDAFGWEILQRHSFLPELRRVARPLDTVFGYSSTCEPTILTGQAPRDHGHFSFFYYDPPNSPFRALAPLRLLPRSLTQRGRVRHWMSRGFKMLSGYTGYFQLYNMPFEHLKLFDYAEKRDLFEPGGVLSGAPTFFDEARRRRVPYFLADWRASEQQNITALEGALDRGEPGFAYLYMAAMDGLLHEVGNGSAGASRVAAKIAWYEEKIRGLLDIAARRYGTLRLHVFSDHGMTDTVAECDVMARIESLGLRFGRDYVASYDSTMARFWFLEGRAEERIRAALEEEPAGRVLADETLVEWGVDFPGQRYGELFYLMNPGVLLNPSFMGIKAMAGMHGFDPTHKDSVAMYLSNVEVDAPPEGLADMYSLACAEIALVEGGG